MSKQKNSETSIKYGRKMTNYIRKKKVEFLLSLLIKAFLFTSILNTAST